MSELNDFDVLGSIDDNGLVISIDQTTTNSDNTLFDNDFGNTGQIIEILANNTVDFEQDIDFQVDDEKTDIDLIIEQLGSGNTKSLYRIEMTEPESTPVVAETIEDLNTVYTFKIPRSVKVYVKTPAEWQRYTRILKKGDFGFVDDVNVALKIGDGINSWNNLPYMFRNASESYNGFMSADSMQKLNKVFEMSSEIDVGNLVALFENKLL